MINIPQQVSLALCQMKNAGYEAYIVGGCVRDFLLGRIPSDYDITTNALPEQTQNIFNSFRCIDIGKKHGTIAVMINGMQIEITTYRIDGKYSDKRHPETVSFSSSLKDDLSRRDFTINAMAYNAEEGIVDCYGGQQDIEEKIIRCVGDPLKRFNEDALRIMRAVRFASQLGFKIDPLTRKNIFELKETLKLISAERLRGELQKLICGKAAFEILMEYHEIITVFIPEAADCIKFDQHNKYHKYTVWEHIARSIMNSPSDPLIRITMLLHDIAKPSCFSLDQKGNGHFKKHPEIGAEMAGNILKRLKYDNKTIHDVVTLIKYHDFKFRSRQDIKRIMSAIGTSLFYRLIDVQQADADSKDGICHSLINDLEWVRTTADNIIENKECIFISDMNINGYQLLRQGYEGKQIGHILNTLLNEVINDTLPNEYNALCQRAGQII